MKTTIRSFCALAVLLTAAADARAQTPEDFQVLIRGNTIAADGGEKWSVGMSTGPATVGKATPAVFSFESCGNFAVSGGYAWRQNAPTAGWRAEMTPLRVEDGALTFRLRWTRALDPGKAAIPPAEDVELTLRPGESRPLDSVPVAAARTNEGTPCKIATATLRVSVEHYPSDEFDRRLVSAAVWLIERLDSGAERSESIALRGLPNRPMPFYFDRISDGKAALDISGHLIARPHAGGLRVAVQTRGRWGEYSFDDQGRPVTSRWTESTLEVKPDEIVEVKLPRLDTGPFTNRSFSLRLRARQLR